MIPVTKPFLPPLEKYTAYLQGIWDRNWLTNDGPLVNELESKLKEHLKLENLLFVSNGTIAIQIAIKALGIKGKIITTPFSYVATTSSIVWENCSPVFVDINPTTFNIDPLQIESKIDQDTTAILATHCFGNACDIESIDLIAKKHGLKVIYDAAHCFGTNFRGKSIFEYGDVSTTSFHSTKLFHSVEGGAVITRSQEVLRKMALMRNFGHNGPEKFNGVGINGKNSELHAAMGLCNLQYIEKILAKRKSLSQYYDQALQRLDVQRIKIQDGCDFNYAYYPIVFKSEEQALLSKETLERNSVFPRRYFYPSLSSLNYVNKTTMPVSESVSKRILCLPQYYELTSGDIDVMAKILMDAQK